MFVSSYDQHDHVFLEAQYIYAILIRKAVCHGTGRTRARVAFGNPAFKIISKYGEERLAAGRLLVLLALGPLQQLH